MGEAKVSTFEPDFNRSVKVEFTDQRITSNAGVLLLREADFKLELISSIASQMRDARRQDLIRYQLGDLLRERRHEALRVPGRALANGGGDFGVMGRVGRARRRSAPTVGRVAVAEQLLRAGDDAVDDRRSEVEFVVCPRRSQFDPPCRSQLDPGMGAGDLAAGCG